ncbi:pif1 [Cryptophlebia peltastica nucleopolyhedrovirus]|uniref:Pif1 n=1 Tax=Cryptophlebia peltastica nucleopolyhedrovirus TaxID=2304025 RepID=A0A346RNY6_9ABAC|nr:pif1 [Cryptophlebia peltastica nucleopolyhedrovirus]AXS67783.1 pif1 [Cryptophlebia peltastica nucleopolyhedrovirus]
MIVIIVCFIIIVIILATLIILLKTDYEPAQTVLLRFDNSETPLIEPPSEIIIEGNSHECHKTLTPCNTHMDCDICREGLANCQQFDDRTVITMHDTDGNEIEKVIEAGESYCMALDRNRARSCNPNTGIWLLAESSTGFSLLCSCITPGLVTQLNMYEDCNVSVGCQPNGSIVDLHERPLRCQCNEGYVSDFNSETETPFCRPLTVRDVIYDQRFFHRAPCEAGFVRLDHPALHERYRQELRLNDICVADPCSIDPISGQRTLGKLMYYKNENSNIEYKYCSCPVVDALFAVYSPTNETMIGQSSANVSNACIRPFNQSLLFLRKLDYKFFWAQSDTTRSDDDVVAMVRVNQLSHERYASILYPYLTNHPDISHTGFMILKFSTAYTPRNEHLLDQNVTDISHQSLFDRYIQLSARTSSPCLYPGEEGRCITANHNDCIRRHGNAQVWTAETFTNSWCFLSRNGTLLRIWSPATRYRNNIYPVALRINVLFAILPNIRDYSVVALVQGNRVNTNNPTGLAEVLNTYSNYSVN